MENEIKALISQEPFWHSFRRKEALDRLSNQGEIQMFGAKTVSALQQNRTEFSYFLSVLP